MMPILGYKAMSSSCGYTYLQGDPGGHLPINGCYLQQGYPTELSDGDILSLSCSKRQSLATCDYLQIIKDRKYDQRTESYLGLI